MHWRQVTIGHRGTGFTDFLRAVRALPAGQLWRHNQAGDLPGVGERINRRQLQRLGRAVRGQRMWTYTHKHTTARSLAAIADFNTTSDGTINLSANNARHADQLAALAIGPVVCVLPPDQTSNTTTPAGRKIVVCPATVRDTVTCASCGLCARKNRACIIGFPAHGAARRKAGAIASA